MNLPPVFPRVQAEKAAAPVIYGSPRIARKRYVEPFGESGLTSTPGQIPDFDQEKRILAAMYAAEPVALSTLRMFLGADRSEAGRPWHKRFPRVGPFSTLLGQLMSEKEVTNADEMKEIEETGPSYNVVKDTVTQPWKAPATTVHEIGHALDFNQGLFAPHGEHNWLHGLARDLYLLGGILPPVLLWQEHAAWRRGRDAYLRGALASDYSAEEIKEVLREIRKAKSPALGTYWGGALGLGAGLAAAPFFLSLVKNEAMVLPVLLNYLVLLSATGAVGTLAGLGIGNLLAKFDWPSIDDEVDRAIQRLRKRRERGDVIPEELTSIFFEPLQEVSPYRPQRASPRTKRPAADSRQTGPSNKPRRAA